MNQYLFIFTITEFKFDFETQKQSQIKNNLQILLGVQCYNPNGILIFW